MNKLILLPAVASFILCHTIMTGDKDPHPKRENLNFVTTDEMKQVSVQGFLRSLAFAPGTPPVITSAADFSHRLIKDSDVDLLFGLINSKQKCKCIVNPLSSIVRSDSAELGGYAIELITAYKKQKPVDFGLYKCPKTDSLTADRLLKWRIASRHKQISGQPFISRK